MRQYQYHKIKRDIGRCRAQVDIVIIQTYLSVTGISVGVYRPARMERGAGEKVRQHRDDHPEETENTRNDEGDSKSSYTAKETMVERQRRKLDECDADVVQ